jgi:hypothetical protein
VSERDEGVGLFLEHRKGRLRDRLFSVRHIARALDNRGDGVVGEGFDEAAEVEVELGGVLGVRHQPKAAVVRLHGRIKNDAADGFIAAENI